MTVYIDVPLRGGYTAGWGRPGWCHMATDGELEELHKFAESLGLRRMYLQGIRKGHPHYDLSPGKRSLAIAQGAVVVDAKTLFLNCFGLERFGTEDGNEQRSE